MYKKIKPRGIFGLFLFSFLKFFGAGHQVTLINDTGTSIGVADNNGFQRLGPNQAVVLANVRSIGLSCHHPLTHVLTSVGATLRDDNHTISTRFDENGEMIIDQDGSVRLPRLQAD